MSSYRSVSNSLLLLVKILTLLEMVWRCCRSMSFIWNWHCGVIVAFWNDAMPRRLQILEFRMMSGKDEMLRGIICHFMIPGKQKLEKHANTMTRNYSVLNPLVLERLFWKTWFFFHNSAALKMLNEDKQFQLRSKDVADSVLCSSMLELLLDLKLNALSAIF